METEFTTSDGLLRRWLHYIDGFKALCKAPMCRPGLQGKFQANSCPVGVLALHMVGGVVHYGSVLVRSGPIRARWSQDVSDYYARSLPLLPFSLNGKWPDRSK
jgi:hypothetical protein